MNLNINSRFKLNNGIEIPCIGLGTYDIRGKKEVNRAVQSSLEAGYRLIDTAAAYYNEKEIGEAIKNTPVPREEIFITTKLDNSDHGYDKTLKAFDKSLKLLGLDYIDLYLIHWPITGKRNESWKAMEELLKQNKCRAIGVSNYTVRHLKELFESSSIVPAVNQVEFNPFIFQEEILEFCSKNNISVEGYTPIARRRKFNHPVVKTISDKYEKTPAQIMLRWALQHNVIAIPKSSDPKRIKENVNIFDFNISEEDMKDLNSLDESLRFSPDPYTYD